MAIKFNVPDQYFAIGFGSSMSGSDIWVFEIVDSAISASDRVGIGYTTPPLDTAQGGEDNLEVLGYEITSSYSLVKVTRALDTGDSNDAVISPGSTTLIWATASSPTLAYHGTSRGVTTVDFEEGTSSTSAVYGSGELVTNYSNTIKVHAIVNAIAWLILSDLAILIVRLFRGKKLRIGRVVIPIQLIHGLIMLMVIIMSVVVTALALKEFLKSYGSAKTTGMRRRDFHYLNGLVILFLILIALISGILALVFLARYKKGPSSRLIIKRAHQVLGYLLYLDAKANIITGVLLYDTKKWKIPVFIYLGVLLLAHLLVQLVISLAYMFSNKEPEKASKITLTSKQSALLAAINRGDSQESLIKNFPQIKWVILGNSVYDLTNWIHPGGNFIIQACVGREVGRYFYGGHALEETKIKPHKHSAITLSQMKSCEIGEIVSPESILVSSKDTMKEVVSTSDKTWKLISIKPVSDTIGQVCFANADIQVKNFGTSLSWLGRHFRISFNDNSSIARLYTTALALNEANIYLRQNMYNYFDDVMAGNTISAFKYDLNYLATQDCLPFFIKNYANFKRGLSRKIHQTEINGKLNEFRIEGPLGRGLEIDSENITIICAGTGILPLIDFLNLFLWKNMYEVIKEKAGADKAKQINILNLPFETILNGLQMTFIGSFANENDFIGSDIVKKLAEISKRYNQNNFRAIIKGCSHEHITQLDKRLDRSLLTEIVDANHDKYFVVGPPDFNNNTLQTLKKLGIKKQKITLV